MNVVKKLVYCLVFLKKIGKVFLGFFKKIVKCRAIILTFITLFLSISSYTIFKFNQRPANTPENFIQSKKKRKKVVVCVGDSNTQGAMAENFVDKLRNDKKFQKFEFVNAGINGDLAFNVLNRIDEIIACSPDYVILMIGSNDILATLNLANELRFERKKDLPNKPNEAWYISNLTKIIDELKKRTNGEIAILSLPLISEKINSIPYDKSIAYSKLIKEISKNEEIFYLPLNEVQQNYLHDHQNKVAKPYDSSLFVYFVPAFKHYVLNQSWKDISSKRGLMLTVDTVHQNDIGANMIKELVGNYLYQSEQNK